MRKTHEEDSAVRMKRQEEDSGGRVRRKSQKSGGRLRSQEEDSGGRLRRKTQESGGRLRRKTQESGGRLGINLMKKVVKRFSVSSSDTEGTIWSSRCGALKKPGKHRSRVRGFVVPTQNR